MRHRKKQKDESLIGKTINNWYVINENGRNKQGVKIYCCKCLRCGNIAVRTQNQIERVKTGTCINCLPDYHFEIKSGAAMGILPSGHVFIVDEDDVDRVSKIFWHIQSKSGYVIGKCEDGKDWGLHQFILNFRGIKEIIIDHINRDKLDCRKSNLRLVTQQQNSMNRSLNRNNKSGYTGVSYISSLKKYRAKIVLNGNHIRLGYSTDPVECAQMYNYASFLLFGEYASKCNDVPEASDKIKKSVEEKCLPYMEQALKATQRCSLF